jgi:hypothetical protein
MPKQKGGSPFTDSWFEMPFWILLFLIIITLILLWQFGIFNKPVAIAQPVKGTFVPVKPNIAQPELTIEEIDPHSDGMRVSLSYSTKYATQGQSVAVRPNSYEDGPGQFTILPIGKYTITVQLYNSPKYNERLILESYIVSADGTGLSPLLTSPFIFQTTQPGARL